MADKNPVGRPRVRPKDAVALGPIFIAPAERERINAAAAKANLSASQWMRRELLRAASVK